VPRDEGRSLDKAVVTLTRVLMVALLLLHHVLNCLSWHCVVAFPHILRGWWVSLKVDNPRDKKHRVLDITLIVLDEVCGDPLEASGEVATEDVVASSLTLHHLDQFGHLPLYRV
jgi:hypothetical protein